MLCLICIILNGSFHIKSQPGIIISLKKFSHLLPETGFCHSARRTLLIGQPVDVECEVDGFETQTVEIGSPEATSIDNVRNHAVGLIAVICLDEFVSNSASKRQQR
jgi:hypothetical protein